MKRKSQEGEELKEENKFQDEEVKEPDNKRMKLENEYIIEQKPQQEAEPSYIDKLKLPSFEALEELSERKECFNCKQSRKYFCYDCFIPLNEDRSKIPRLQLPVNVTVLRHPKEKISKSSIIPSKIIAPDNVEIKHEMEIQPIKTEQDSYDSIVLLFPSDDAKNIHTMSTEELLQIKRVVLIDCTWNQTKHFLRQDAVKELKKVKIQTEKTVFWRHQNIAETNLSTIEAMYFFFRDYDVNLNCGGDYAKYDGKYDTLLYYYAFNYKLIQKVYTEGEKKFKKFYKIKGYIKGREDGDDEDTYDGRDIGGDKPQRKNKQKNQKKQQQ